MKNDLQTTREQALQDLENYINKDIVNYLHKEISILGLVKEIMFRVYLLIYLID